MNKQAVYIKNMCCQRCIDAVQSELESLKLQFENIRLGSVVFKSNVLIKMPELKKALEKRGFELLLSEEDRIVEEVKISLIELIRQTSDNEHKVHLSDFLEQRIKKPYRYIYKLFFGRTGLNIENYLILQRVEKVKELIEQNELNFSEIAYCTGYKTLQHLSGQFKKTTGMSMMKYKNAKNKNRVAIDKI